ncbi:HipA N-terminal domain-containing protein [Fibrella aquatica]|jgi:HipA-like protein|uniref:HipA N-terminal domain-containing protein n=1 Tax=Fibrella aquatica TaxID=3242487 RepID=UPI00351FA794
MTTTLQILYNGRLAGYLSENRQASSGLRYTFRYVDAYRQDATARPIALAFPKKETDYTADVLFPFFYNMLAEGDNRRLQCQVFRIDEQDFMTLLARTAQHETIGPVTVQIDVD